MTRNWKSLGPTNKRRDWRASAHGATCADVLISGIVNLSSIAVGSRPMPRRDWIQAGAGGGGRTHMFSEERGILSPVRLPVPPLQPEGETTPSITIESNF
jgi:hypothetical protein